MRTAARSTYLTSASGCSARSLETISRLSSRLAELPPRMLESMCSIFMVVSKSGASAPYGQKVIPWNNDLIIQANRNILFH